MVRIDRQPRRRLPVAQRRGALLSAAAAAFAAAPYDQVSLAAIAKEAGASEALVHRYYATKGDLYTAVLTSAVDDLQSRRAAADAEIGGADADRWVRVAISVGAYLDLLCDDTLGWAAPLRLPQRSFPAAQETLAGARTAAKGFLAESLGLSDSATTDHVIAGFIAFLDASAQSWRDAGADEEARGSLLTMALGALSGALAALDA